MSEEKQVYEFPTELQRRLLAMMVFDGPNYQLYKEIIKAEYFENQVFQDLAKIILDFYESYGRPPCADELVHKIGELLISRAHLPEDEYFGEYQKIMTIGPEGNFDYIRDQVVEFAKYEAMRGALIESATVLKSQKDLEPVRRIVEKALNIGISRDNLGTQYFQALDDRLIRREAGIVRAEQTVPTGILDGYMGGGLMKSELGIIMGPMKRGKTIFAMNLAKTALAFNFNVLHIVLEMSEQRLEDRYDSMISGIPQGELKARTVEVKARVEEFKNRGSVGKLVIKHFPAGMTTAATFENVINKLRAVDNFTPHLVIVDYLGLMSNPAAHKSYEAGSRYTVFGQHTKDLIGMAHKYNCAVWLVMQSTRGSITKATVGLQDSADSVEPLRDADIILTINQKADEVEKKLIRVYIAGGRDVEDKKFAVCNIDYAVCRVTPLTDEEQARYRHNIQFDDEGPNA